LAGTAVFSGTEDGTGPDAHFGSPSGITTDGTNLYVADSRNSTIRKIVISTREVTTLAGAAGVFGATDGTGSAALFNYPAGMTTDGSNLYIVDSSSSTIRQIVIATGSVTTLAGTAGTRGSTDGTGGAALFNYPIGIALDGSNLYVTDTGNGTIRKIIISEAQVMTLAGTAGKVGSVDGIAASARFSIPVGIVTVGTGTTLYIADMGTIRKIQ
jgi:sugar lactone lactonase YvrE